MKPGWFALALPTLAMACERPVYLSFDTGHMGVAEQIVATLDRHQVPATFFLAAEPTLDGGHSLDAQWAPFWRRLAAQGTWVIMFPEGTRIERGEFGHYKTGGSRLAIDTGLAVQPVACATAKVWPPRSLLLRPGVYEISVGPAIASAGHTPESLMAQTRDWIEAEMRRLDPEAYRAPAPPAAAPTPVPIR